MQDNISKNKEDLEKIAISFYDPQFEYHNFNHALDTWKAAQEIIKRCRQEGKKVDEKVVYYASIFHDAGYHEDEKTKGFGTKEDYAAKIAEEELVKLDIDQVVIKQVVDAILVTEREHAIAGLSIEAMIVRAADLAAFAQSYEIFLKNNQKLKLEAERIKSGSISEAEWKAKTKEITEFYLSQKIQLTHSYADEHGESIFHKKTRENLEKFLRE